MAAWNIVTYAPGLSRIVAPPPPSFLSCQWGAHNECDDIYWFPAKEFKEFCFEHERPISIEEVNEMKSGKAPGLDEFPVECLKKGIMASKTIEGKFWYWGSA